MRGANCICSSVRRRQQQRLLLDIFWRGKLAVRKMSDEINIDSIIARLLEGNF